MASLRADETHLDEVEDFLESRTQYKHLKARRRGDAIIIESGAKADPSTHARLRRISAQRWSLEMADHRGRREPTPYTGTLESLLTQLASDFPWALEARE